MNLAEIIARTRPGWMADPQRGCAGVEAEEMMAARLSRRHREMCGDCPHVQACATYALERPELSGVWGGTTARMRRDIRRRVAA